MPDCRCTLSLPHAHLHASSWTPSEHEHKLAEGGVNYWGPAHCEMAFRWCLAGHRHNARGQHHRPTLDPNDDTPTTTILSPETLNAHAATLILRGLSQIQYSPPHS